MRISAIRTALTSIKSGQTKRIVKRLSGAVKKETQLISTSIKNKEYGNLFKVENPIHGTIKYGALGFLIPIPGMQIVGMALGAIAGLIPKARKLLAIIPK